MELKSLTSEVTKLSLQNAKLVKELQTARELSSRSSSGPTGNGGTRRYNDAQRTGRRGRISGRSNDVTGMVNDEFDSWNLDVDDLKMELQARKQREAALETALAEKEILEDEYRRKFEEARKRESSLENDLANMWVLVARLKKEGIVMQESKCSLRQNEDIDQTCDEKVNGVDCMDLLPDPHRSRDNSSPVSIIPIEEPLVPTSNIPEEPLVPVSNIPKEELFVPASIVSTEEPCVTVSNVHNEEPLVVRLKARMQEIKEKELRYTGIGDATSHVC